MRPSPPAPPAWRIAGRPLLRLVDSEHRSGAGDSHRHCRFAARQGRTKPAWKCELRIALPDKGRPGGYQARSGFGVHAQPYERRMARHERDRRRGGEGSHCGHRESDRQAAGRNDGGNRRPLERQGLERRDGRQNEDMVQEGQGSGKEPVADLGATGIKECRSSKTATNRRQLGRGTTASLGSVADRHCRRRQCRQRRSGRPRANGLTRTGADRP